MRFRLAVDKYLAERGLPYKALVAFSGTVRDGGQAYTETAMNGFSEAQTAQDLRSSRESLSHRRQQVPDRFRSGHYSNIAESRRRGLLPALNPQIASAARLTTARLSFSKLPVFDLASSLQKFPSHYGQHIFGIGVPRLGCSFKAL